MHSKHVHIQRYPESINGCSSPGNKTLVLLGVALQITALTL